MSEADGAPDDPEPFAQFVPIGGRGSSRSRALRRFARNRLAVASGILLVLLLGLTVGANLLPLQSPTSHGADLLPDAQPGSAHWLGTDANGIDLLSRLIYGMRAPFAAGIIGQTITVLLGVTGGVVAGYFGGWIDRALTQLANLVFAFPHFVLAYLVVGLYQPQFALAAGGAGSVLVIAIVFALVGWPGLLRLVRSLVLSLRTQGYVEAARALGVPTRRIVQAHVVPALLGMVLVQSSFGVGGYIGAEASISLLGMGVQRPNPDLGVMLGDGYNRLSLNAIEAVAPTVLLAVILIAFVFVSDGLRDAMDPWAPL